MLAGRFANVLPTETELADSVGVVQSQFACNRHLLSIILKSKCCLFVCLFPCVFVSSGRIHDSAGASRRTLGDVEESWAGEQKGLVNYGGQPNPKGPSTP